MNNKYLSRLSVDICRYKAKKIRKWKDSTTIKVLFITENTRICNSQIYPFYFFKKEIVKSLDSVEFREINIELFEKHYKLGEIERAEVVFFQPWFNKDYKLIVALLTQIRDVNPLAKIIFLDSFAPLDLRFVDSVSPLIDFYIKKHVFQNREMYFCSTHGDTNLVEYYNNLYGGLPEEEVHFNIPDGFMEKLVVGPSFFTSRDMLPAIARDNRPPMFTKKIDVHARLGAVGTGWYQQMREHALLACEEFKDNSIITSKSVSNSTYMKELRSSRICFSPFGYGEVCWRDYEAIICGAMLIKPDMSHLETNPNIFVPFETYIPIAWDFSDLAEKINYYLEHKDEREKITRAAYDVVYNYIQAGEFGKQISFLVNS
jgi:hypothetical protein